MPKHKHYGYLELVDVSNLIEADGNASRSEREWRKKLKELTGTRMNTSTDESETSTTSRTNSGRKRLSFGHTTGGTAKPRVGFADEAPPPEARTSPSMSLNSGPDTHLARPIPPQVSRHEGSPYSLSPSPGSGHNSSRLNVANFAATPEPASSDEERPGPPLHDFDGMRRMQTPEPVSQPPTFSHAPGDKPSNRPYHSPEMRRANSRLSINTLKQLSTVGNAPVDQDAWSPNDERNNEEQDDISRRNPDQYGPPLVHLNANDAGIPAPLSPGFPLPDTGPVSQYPRSPPNPEIGAPHDSRGPITTARPRRRPPGQARLQGIGRQVRKVISSQAIVVRRPLVHLRAHLSCRRAVGVVVVHRPICKVLVVVIPVMGPKAYIAGTNQALLGQAEEAGLNLLHRTENHYLC